MSTEKSQIGGMFKIDLAYENWRDKYRYGNETPLETQERVAKAAAEAEKPELREIWKDKFLKTLVKLDATGNPIGLKCTPGGRITANAGTEFSKATLLNCFIAAPVSGATISYSRKSEEAGIGYDVSIKTSDSPDDLINIFLTVAEQAKTLASEGGYGINFDFIRPRGSHIKGTGIKHPGVVAYMKIWDAVSQCIVQGSDDGYTDKLRNYLSDEKLSEVKKIVKASIRKGAQMAVLSCSHPDVEEFVRAKQESGVLTKFNMSVLLDDPFMKAVEADEFYEQLFNGRLVKRVKARELYNLIMESCYNRAEPGVLFVDNYHSNNPISYIGKALCTNPCGEVYGLTNLTSVCLLGSLNLTQYVELDVNKVATFDWDKYREDIFVLVRFLDNINDISYNPLPGYDWAMKNLRQIGMGVNGLGSALMMLRLPYNSKEGLEFVKKVCSIKENCAWQASALLAKEKGTFPAYKKKEFESTEYFKSDRITEETKALMRKHGVRNAKTTTQPPLGNSSLICSNVSNSLEPAFRLEYDRKVMCKTWPAGLSKDNVESVLKHTKEKDYDCWVGEYAGKRYYYEPHNRGLCEVHTIRDYGYSWLLENFPEEDHSAYAITAKDLTIDDHLNVQEIFQKYNNQATSKTSNLPKNYPFEDFKRLYMDAWKRKLVGFTTYREGSMESVLSSVQKTAKESGIITKDIKLPNTFLNGPTSVIKREHKKFYIHFSYLPEDTAMEFPVVLWIYTNVHYKEDLKICNAATRNLAKLALKLGVDNKIVEEALEKCKEDYPHNRLGRMISLNLRHNVPRGAILSSLMGVEGDNISTLLSAVKKFLGSTLKDGTRLHGMKCPKCQSDNMIMTAGCYTCQDCLYSGCGA